MADDNKIQFDVELNQQSIDSSFKFVDERAVKSAKSSAAVFGEAFQKQEQDLEKSIQKIVASTKAVAQKSAQESASVFEALFKKQENIYKASVKQNLDNAIKALTGGDSIKKSAQESASVFEDAFAKETKNFEGIEPVSPFAVRNLTDLAAGIFVVKQAVDTLGSAFKKALDFVIQGESEFKLEQRFKALAEQAGIASDVIDNQLVKSVRGLVDDSQVLSVASEAFVRIGANAKQLPEVFELARKSVKVFGGDVVSNSSAIVSAIETGNKRQLRGIGLYTDLDAAVKNYARSIGTVPALLTEQQIQAARLNAILETGGTRFKNISAESEGAKDAFTRLGVAFKNVSDELAKNQAKFSGGFFKSLASGAADALAGFAESLKNSRGPQNISEARERIELAQKSLVKYQEELSKLEKNDYQGIAFFNTRIQDATVLIDKLKSKIEDFREVERKQGAVDVSTGGGGAAAGVGAADQAVNDEFIRRRQELALKVQELNNQVNQSEIELLQQRFQRDQTVANLEQLVFQQRKFENEKFLQERAQLQKFFEENGIVDDTLREKAKEALRQAHVNRLYQIDADYAERRKLLFIDTEMQAISVGAAFEQITEGMEASAQELSVNAAKNFKNLGKTMFQSIGSASANAFAAFGQAIATGEDALSAFGKSLLNSLGQMAIQMGSMFILQGLAYTYAGIANGPPLIAAGAALAVIGGVLAASTGAGPNDRSGGGISGGSPSFDTTDSNPINEPIAPEDTIAQTPQTAVNLTINGNVLDRRATGLELAQILEEQFAEQGLVVRGA